MSIDSNAGDLLLAGKSGRSVAEACQKQLGMITLEDAARQKVIDGITCVDEMIRVLI